MVRRNDDGEEERPVKEKARRVRTVEVKRAMV